MVIGLIGQIKLNSAFESHDLAVAKELKSLRERNSREYAQGIIETYQRVFPPVGKIKRIFGLERICENPLYDAAIQFLGIQSAYTVIKSVTKRRED